MATMTIADRTAHYKKVYAKYPASHPWLVQEQDRHVLYAVWVMGQDYRNKTPLYGAYPPDYVNRIDALFPDATNVLHAFSGSLPAGDYERLDSVNRTLDTARERFTLGSVYDTADYYTTPFDLIVADPPYSDDDAEKYQTPMINRVKAFAGLAPALHQGGHLVWLDTTWPIHSKTQWVTVGRICIIRSTNHRVRLCSIFERVS